MQRGTLTPHPPGDVADHLRAMMGKGFRFALNTGNDGGIVAVVGVRVHDDVIDIVELFGHRDADGVRIPGTEPDILFPRTVLWRATGAPAEVIERMLALPDQEPAARSGAGPAKGCWVPTGRGRATWLGAGAGGTP